MKNFEIACTIIMKDIFNILKIEQPKHCIVSLHYEVTLKEIQPLSYSKVESALIHPYHIKLFEGTDPNLITVEYFPQSILTSIDSINIY